VGFEFLKRVRNTTVLTALVIALFVVAYWQFAAGVAWLTGCAWSLANLYAIGLLVNTLLARGKTPRVRVVVLVLAKVPVLYAIGFALLSTDWLPLTFLLAGFTWPIAVIVLKVFGRALLKLDDPRRILWRGDSEAIHKGSVGRSN
jgi:hypothetical protein